MTRGARHCPSKMLKAEKSSSPPIFAEETGRGGGGAPRGVEIKTYAFGLSSGTATPVTGG